MRRASAPGIDKWFFTWPSDVWPRFYSGEMDAADGRGTTMIENTWLPKIERCVIKGVSVNYSTQEPYHQHSDGSPTIVELTFSLEEIVQQTRDVINTGHGETVTRPTLKEKFEQARG